MADLLVNGVEHWQATTRHIVPAGATQPRPPRRDLGWTGEPSGAIYTLSIWSYISTGAPGQFSHPGASLWTQSYTNGQFTRCNYINLIENFYNAFLDPMFYTTNLYQMCFRADPGNTFRQTGTATAPTNYWLSVAVEATAMPARYFGWKSSAAASSDSAVVGVSGLYPAPGDWRRLGDLEGNPLNFAFAVTTSTNPCPRPVIQSITRFANQITVRWTDGVLQQADRVTGPFTDVPAAVPPSFTVPAFGAAGFYRLRCVTVDH